MLGICCLSADRNSHSPNDTAIIFSVVLESYVLTFKKIKIQFYYKYIKTIIGHEFRVKS